MVSSGGKILLDIFLPSQNSTIDQIPHPPPKNRKTNPMPPNKCSGLVEYLFQNHTDIISTKPLMVRFQLYFVLPAVRGLWFTTNSPTLNPFIYKIAGINLCCSPYKVICSKHSLRYTFREQPLS